MKLNLLRVEVQNQANQRNSDVIRRVLDKSPDFDYATIREKLMQLARQRTDLLRKIDNTIRSVSHCNEVCDGLFDMMPEPISLNTRPIWKEVRGIMRREEKLKKRLATCS